MRRAVLAVVALVALAGCSGVAPGHSSSSSPTPTATTTPYPNETVAFPDGPKSRPALPDAITAESAASYATTHEYRYSYNEFWAGPGTEVGMSEHSCQIESTEATGDGYVVVLQCTAYVNEPTEDASSTQTQHFDYPPWTVRYYVDENSVLRDELE